MVDYNVERNALGKRHVSVLDEGYLEVMQAAHAINTFGLEDEKEQSKREFEEACTAPLAKAEEHDEESEEQTKEERNSTLEFLGIWLKNFKFLKLKRFV